MEYKSYPLAKLGDYDAHRVDVYENSILQVSLIFKLTATEMAVAKNRQCIKDDAEGIKKLAAYTEMEAKKIAESGKYEVGQVFEKFYSPCW